MPSEAPPKKNAYFPGQRCGCRRLLDIMQVGICVTDAVGTIRFLNPAYAAMFKMDVKETPGRNICEFFPNSALLKVIRSGIPDRRVQFEWMGQKAFISRYPLWEDGVVVGGLIEVYSRDIDELERLLQHIRNLQKKASYYKLKTRGLLRAEYTFDMIVGSSRPMQQLQQQGKKFAQGKQPILITGESGSGKELVAHALHSASPRAEEAFVRVSCAAIPAELIEAELFGYEEGAFTGARSGGRVGRFELADRGTIFLDEIGEMPLPMQAKLLRVLEHGEIQKVGKSESVFSDFRLLAATNRDLQAMVRQERFRADLYHRLNILHLHVPPLRERTADIPSLTAHLLRQLEHNMPHPNLAVDDKAFEILRKYSWPGNIRELKNVLTFALYSMEEGCNVLGARHLPPNVIEKSITTTPRSEATLHDTQMWTTREAISAALERNRGNKSRAARELGISRTELYKKLKKFSLYQKNHPDPPGLA